MRAPEGKVLPGEPPPSIILAVAHYPFHFAFPVRDLASTRAFYGDLLGCREGRSTETWVDFDFFGNQISAHLGPAGPTGAVGHVDEVEVPIPHTGAILPWDEFQRLAEKLTAASTRFVIAPMVRYRGRPEEQATMFLLDPSGNALELKAYRDPAAVYHR